MQDPELYLERTDPKLLDPVRRDRDAVLHASLRARVNHEAYFFSGDDTLAEFDRRPLRYVGRVTDPVSGLRFRPDEASPTLDYRGRKYFFTDETTRAAFRKAPERHAEPQRRMR